MTIAWVYVNRSLTDRPDVFNKAELLQDAVEGLRIMFGVDAWFMDAPQPASIGKAAIAIAQFMLRPDYIPEWLAIARRTIDTKSFILDPQYKAKELKGFKPIVPIVTLVAQSSKATVAYAFSSLVANGFLEAALLDVPAGPEIPQDLRPYAMPFSPSSGSLPLIPLARFAQRLTVGSILAQCRPCAARDHLWLSWQKQDQLTPAKIRDRWNLLSESEREHIVPYCFKKLARNTGCDTVKKGLRQAKGEDATLGEEFRLSGVVA